MTDFSLDKLVAAQTEAEGLGVVFPEALKGALREAADPHYKIGVMGRFQAGKTTLVNRVFLRQPLLKEGEGLCTTAVCTEVTYGPEAKLTLVKDGVTQTFSPPTAEAIVAATTASTEEERLALAESITQLRIETPTRTCAATSSWTPPAWTTRTAPCWTSPPTVSCRSATWCSWWRTPASSPRSISTSCAAPSSRRG